MSYKTVLMVLAVGGIALTILPVEADAQRARRYRGRATSVRAPFVRVEVGPNGETYVRAPFVAVDDPAGPYGPGQTYVGLGRRRRRIPSYAQAGAYQPGQAQAMQPTPAGAQPMPAGAQPVPSVQQLSAMEIPQLVEALSALSARLQHSLMRFDNPSGWQRYLELPQEALGNPETGEMAIRLDLLEQTLANYRKAASQPKFAKVARLSSFVATHTALELIVDRLRGEGIVEQQGPQLTPQSDENLRSDPGPVTEQIEIEPLRAPEPEPEPEPRHGERSILKRR